MRVPHDSYTSLVNGIKQHQKPSCLEQYRMQIHREWTDGDREINNCVSESEALSMAIAHSHEEYIDYLLLERPVRALKTSGFSCSHLARAVESDQPVVVRKLVRHTLKLQSADHQPGVSRIKDLFKCKKRTPNAVLRYLDKPSGCMVSGPSKTAVHLACELGRVTCLGELLRHGAAPTPKDKTGLTPVDHAIRKLCSSYTKNASTADIALALKDLISFLPVVRATPATLEILRQTVKQQDLPEEMRDVLKWILNEINTPRSLQQICKHQIRSVIGQSGIEPMPTGVFQLPLPSLMKQYLL